MYSYNIAKKANKEIFDNTRSLIESNISGIDKERLIEDVDGTQIQIYNVNGKKIKVFNDYEVDAVYIDSELDIENIIKD